MKRWLHISRQLIVVLLIFQVNVAYALPTEGHLNLCFGFDGHIDISKDDCASDSSQLSQKSDSVLLTADDHHNDCLDVVLGCVSPEEMRPSQVVSSSITKISENYSSPLAENYRFSFSLQTLQSSTRTSLHLNGRSFTSSHLGALRSVLLLI